ncbi:MAG: histidine kinase [Leptospiraceae bacterium]|nr:histidine kinase [Leptospiraceae bacterium]
MPAEIDPSLLEKINKTIAERDRISVKSSKINSKLEHYVQKVIRSILIKYDQEKYMDMIYTILKELAINAVKANQKRIFFEENGFNIFDEANYSEAMKKFKAIFSDKMAEEYGKKCQEKGIFCQMNFFFNNTGMAVEVINNTPVIKAEEIRMREKMKKSMNYNDIAEFYMDNADNTEGAGLGIALIIILLKNENIDPNLFRIITKPEKTVARIEVPFTPDYVTMRDRERGIK